MGLSLFHPYVLIGLVVAILGAYGGGRIQQRVIDAKGFEKEKAQLILKAQEDLHRVENERQQIVSKSQTALTQQQAIRDHEKEQAVEIIQTLQSEVARLRVRGVARVLNTVIADSADPTRPAGQSPESSAADPATANDETTVEQWAKWSADVIGIYNDCRDSVLGWQDFYHKLQAQH